MSAFTHSRDPIAQLTRRRRRHMRTALVAAAAVAVGLIGPTALSTAATAAVPPNLLMKYDLNEASGTTAIDSSGHGANGTLTNGAAFTASGKNYGGVHLDGTDDYINLPNGALKNTHDVTLSVDVKLDATKHQWYGTLGYTSGKYIGIEQNGGTLTGYFTNSNQQTVSAGNIAPAVGSWANVTFVIDTSTNHNMKLYVNGVLKATTSNITGDPAGIYDSTQSFGGYIGKSVWNGDPYLAGTVDDFRVYNTALSATDVATLAALAPNAPAAVTPVSISTSPTVAPSLPSTVNVPASDGTDQTLPVTWDAVDPSQYASPATFDVTGTTQTTPSLTATAHIAVLPVPALTVDAKDKTTVSLSWSAQDDVSQYVVSRSTSSGGPYTQVYAGTDTSYVDTGLSLGTKYYYVMHYDVTSGGSSTNSPEVAVKTLTELVGPPTLAQSSYLVTNRVDLSWNAVPLADSYKLYKSDSADGPFTLVDDITGLSYKDSDVTQGSTYYYEISSVNDAGEGAKSAPLAAQTAVDSVPPTTVTSSAQADSTITLNWVPKSGATSYSVYRSTTSGSGYSLVYSGDATSDVDANLVTGTTYYYVVTYTTDLGTSIHSKELAVSTVAVKVPAPSTLKALASYANAINLGWNSVVGAQSFKLYRSTSADGSYTLIKTTSGTSFTDTGLDAGTTYYYRISSVNAAGESALSPVAALSTDPGTSTVMTNKVTTYDTDGNPIVGSGSIIKAPGTNTYYRYAGDTGSAGSSDPFGVNVYSSTDLIHWKFESKVIGEGSLDLTGHPAADLQASTGYHFERVGVVYDPNTDKYVMLMHYENSDYTLAEVGTAESDSPTGPFVWDHAFQPAGLDSRDMNTFVDSDGTGYIIASTLTNSHLTLFKLTPDFLSVDSQMYNIYGGANDSGIYAGREAPTMIKSNGVYYLVTSNAAGWYPSDAMYSIARADTLADTTAASWQGDTNVDALGGWDGGGYGYYLGNRNDFGGQSNNLLAVSGTHGTSYIFMNDTLNPQASGMGGPLWLPITLDDGVATVDYSQQININAKAGEVSNIYPGSLLSQGKPAWASSAGTKDSDGNVNPDGWGASYANDGNYNTEWTATGSTYPAYWEVDLGQEYDISDVQLSWWLISGSEAIEDFTIQVSDDNVNWSTAYDLSSGDTQYGFNDAQFPSVAGRYVKVNILASHTHNNNGGWYTPQLYEARVYGSAAPASASASGANASGGYSLQVPANVVNYPATGSYTLNLGNVSVVTPTSVLLSNLGHGALTATNAPATAGELAAATSAGGPSTKIASAFDLGIASADGASVTSFGSPADVTVHLSAADVASLSAAGVPKVYAFDPAAQALTDTGATIDLTAGTATFSASALGRYVIASQLETIGVTTAPSITGAATVGSTVTVSAGAYSVSGVDVSYQWLRNGVAIDGATSASYAVTAADDNTQLTAKVTAAKSGYVSAATTTTVQVADGAIGVTTAPKITGTAKVGSKLAVSTGAYAVSGVDVGYQWLRNGVAIHGATKSSYTATAADYQAQLSVKVTASKPAYGDAVTTTAKTAKVAAGTITVKAAPKISGTAKVGKTLKSTAGSYSVAGVKVSYQWLRGGTAIKGATSAKHVVVKADRKKKLSVRVTVSKTAYTTVKSTSKQTATVK